MMGSSTRIRRASLNEFYAACIASDLEPEAEAGNAKEGPPSSTDPLVEPPPPTLRSG